MMFVSGYVGPSFFHPLNPGSALSALFSCAVPSHRRLRRSCNERPDLPAPTFACAGPARPRDAAAGLPGDALQGTRGARLHAVAGAGRLPGHVGGTAFRGVLQGAAQGHSGDEGRAPHVAPALPGLSRAGRAGQRGRAVSQRGAALRELRNLAARRNGFAPPRPGRSRAPRAPANHRHRNAARLRTDLHAAGRRAQFALAAGQGRPRLVRAPVRRQGVRLDAGAVRVEGKPRHARRCAAARGRTGCVAFSRGASADRDRCAAAGRGVEQGRRVARRADEVRAHEAPDAPLAHRDDGPLRQRGRRHGAPPRGVQAAGRGAASRRIRQAFPGRGGCIRRRAQRCAAAGLQPPHRAAAGNARHRRRAGVAADAAR